MLVNLFYFTGLFIFLFQLLLISNFPKFLFIKEFYVKFQKVTNRKPEKDDFSGGDYDFYNFVVATNVLTTSWFFLGLIGSNWIIFVFYFIYSSILNTFFRLIKNKLFSAIFNFIEIILTFLTVGFLVFNHFHFHSNLTELILR